MTRTARIASLAGALALSTLLAACGGPTTPAPSDSPADPAATPSPSAAGDEGGADHGVATDATCTDLVPAGSLSALFSSPLEPVGPERTSAYIATILDAWWITQAAGGLACEWQTAESVVSSESMYEYRGVRVLLLPATRAAFDDYANQFPSPGDDVSRCTDESCVRDVYVNGWWLSLAGMRFEDPADLADAMRAYDAIVARVRALPAPRPVAHESTLTNHCEVLLPADRVGRAFDAPASAVLVQQAFRGSFRDYVLSSVGGTTCSLSVNGTELGIVETLPSGASAEENAVDAYLALGGTEVLIPIPGVDEPGSLREQVDASGFDFAVNGDWIKIVIWPSASYSTESIASAVANVIIGVG